MKLSFVIPAHNEEERIGSCLASVLAECARSRADAEVVVVNNASTDRTKAVASKYPGVTVVDEPRKGLTRARQRGLEAARGDLVAYLDADSRLLPGWIELVTRTFESPDVVSVSGAPRYYDLEGWNKFAAELGWDLFAPPAYRLTGYMVWGGSFVVRKDAMERAGGFDTTIDFYGEDTDIARRLHRVGKTVFHQRFPVLTSGRRLARKGLGKIYLVYAMNFLSEAFIGKPLTKRSEDIR